MLDKSIVTQNIQVFDLNERLGDSISNVPNIQGEPKGSERFLEAV